MKEPLQEAEKRVESSSLFFFKQKTAYDVVHRDWSSDVCSSVLCVRVCVCVCVRACACVRA